MESKCHLSTNQLASLSFVSPDHDSVKHIVITTTNVQ